MAATIREVATLAGVSFKTVSNVLNEYPHVSTATRERVLDAIDRLSYTPNAAARLLRAGRTGTISVAVPDLGQPYFGELASALAREAARAGQRVLVEQTDGARERELEILAGASRHVTDGLILSPLSLRPEDLSSVRGSTPLVLLGETLFPDAIDHVTMRNVEAVRSAVDLLLAGGRRRIAFVGTLDPHGLGSGTSQLRLEGYLQALRAAGLEIDPMLLQPAGTFHRRDGEHAIEALGARAVPFDAVFAITDDLALGALRALHAAGRRVPEDVAVIGFDGLEVGRYSEPPLTSVDPGRRQIAALAVAALLRRIEDPTAPVRFVEADFSLERRASA